MKSPSRFLFGLGLSDATLSKALTALGTGRTAETHPHPALPKKPVLAPPGPIGPDVIADFERPVSSRPGVKWVRRKDAVPSPINHCHCGRRISANKSKCGRCQ